MKYKEIGILSFGHVASDINQGAISAMLPFFIAAYGLSYTAAAAIVFAVNMSSSVVQPFFGITADRTSMPWLLPIGLIFAGLGIALTGLFDQYPVILLLAIVSGIGIAAYHPEAARLVNFAAGDRKSTAMSIFGIGGTIGFAAGPLIITAALMHWGLAGSLILIVPVLLMSLVISLNFHVFETLKKDNEHIDQNSPQAVGKENWSAFTRIAIIVCGRSIIFFGLNIFIPLYWIHGLSQSKVAGATALTIFVGSGIIGNLVGGTLADRIGPKKVIVLGLASLMVLLPAFIMTTDIKLATLLLIPIGIMLFLCYSPTIVLGQAYLPGRVGLSSGVTLGLSIAIGGGAAPFIGRIADIYGVWMALAFVASLPLLFLIVTLTLPNP
jgi:FSR family fosmidomycin resistance protein-like MFS transporter